MLTPAEYTAATGLEVPEHFAALCNMAEEILHARTLQQFRRNDLPASAAALFRQTAALQVAYMDSRGGLEGWGDPTTLSAGVSLGRFSAHSTAQSARPSASDELLAPGAAALLPALMAYANAWMIGGDC